MIKGHLYTTRKTKLPKWLKRDTKIPFEIPSGWNEVTLEQFIEISKDLDYLEMFSVLSGVELETIKKCRPEEVAYIVEQLESLYNPKELESLSDIVEEFTLNGVTYKVNPNLINDTVGQWWDIKKIEVAMKDEPIKFIPKLIAMIARPEGEEYDYSKVEDRAKEFLQLDVLTAFKVRTFFLSNQLVYLINSNRYLKKSIKVKKLLQVLMRFLGSLVRYLLSFHWLKSIVHYVRSLVERKR